MQNTDQGIWRPIQSNPFNRTFDPMLEPITQHAKPRLNKNTETKSVQLIILQFKWTKVYVSPAVNWPFGNVTITISGCKYFWDNKRQRKRVAMLVIPHMTHLPKTPPLNVKNRHADFNYK